MATWPCQPDPAPQARGRRSDGRPHDTGLVRPMRPCPGDFAERFEELGWEGIEEHYRTNWRVIRRWIDECGRDELRAARADHVKRYGVTMLHAARLD